MAHPRKKHPPMVIIGGGPGGYVAAIRASQLGFDVTLIEKERPGGICLNWGCIPTKALLRSAEVFDLVKESERFGLVLPQETKELWVDRCLEQMVLQACGISDKLVQGIYGLLKHHKVRVVQGHGQLGSFQSSQGLWEVNVLGKDQTVETKVTGGYVLIATGARARTLAHLPQSPLVWTYKEALRPKSLPQSMIVLGSGAIGMEFASFYRSLGTKVYVVELADRILNSEDEEISAYAQQAFQKRGIKFFLKSSVTSCVEKGDGLECVVQDQLTQKEHLLKAEVLLQAVGIVGNTQDIGLEKAGVSLKNSHIETQAFGATGVPGLYAFGDVTAPPWLAHKASHEGVLCVEHLAGESVRPLKTTAIPGCIYSQPQVASVGLTEKQAKDKGYPVKVGRSSLGVNGKALGMREAHGMMKTIFHEETGEFLGAHMIGPEVTEIIQGCVIAKNLEATEEDLAGTVFPHPTLSEALHESVLDALGKKLHG